MDVCWLTKFRFHVLNHDPFGSHADQDDHNHAGHGVAERFDASRVAHSWALIPLTAARRSSNWSGSHVASCGIAATHPIAMSWMTMNGMMPR